MVPVPVNSPVSYTDDKWGLKAEIQNGIAWNTHSASLRLTSIDRSKNVSDQTIIAL